MSLMWIPAHTTTPPGHDVRQRFGNEAADRREDDRRVERLRRRLGGRARPRRAEAARELLRGRRRPAT